MAGSPNVADRLRIERATWLLDARLQDLPRASRIARRRELRENLRAAAADVGARQAVRQLGDLRDLAAEYLAAEYGDAARRPSWLAAAVTFAAIDVFLLILGYASSAAFRAGVGASAPGSTGVVRWHGVRYLISDETFTYVNGTSTSVGGAWTPWAYGLMFSATVVAGRLWRLFPALRRRTGEIEW